MLRGTGRRWGFSFELTTHVVSNLESGDVSPSREGRARRRGYGGW